MNRACGKFGRTGEVHTGLWWGDLGERNNLQDLGVDGMIIIETRLSRNRMGSE